jgi:Ca2+-binding RTX toxin-like protein
MTTINGTSAGETLTGGADADLIYGYGGVDTLTGAAGNDSLYGGGDNDVIYGGEGDDTLDGGTGADYMVGGSGWDSYVVDSVYDVIVEEAGPWSGTNMRDAVTSSVSFASNSVEDITLIGTANLNASYSGSNVSTLTGNKGNNIITGGSGLNFLYGGEGSDVLYGGSGDDNLEGGAGADVLDGGAGRNFANYTRSLVGIVASLSNPSINTGDAVGDTYVNVDNLIGSFWYSDYLFGNDFSNIIRGNGGDDWLYGGGGSDSLEGDWGNDYLFGGAGADALNGGDGFDLARYDYAAWGVSAALYDPSVNNGEAAGDRYTSIEGLVGSGYADYLYGDSNANYIDGLGGNDYMAGGAGNDVYAVDTTQDFVSESPTAAGGVADYIYSSVSFTAAAGIEGLFLTGSANIYAVGANGQNDLLIGNGGSNSFFGLSGNDYLLGGAGSDYFVFNYDVAAGQVDVIGDFAAGVDYIGLPSYLKGNVHVLDTAYGVDVACYVSGSWYQIFVANTHNVAQVTAGIYYA